MSARRAASRRRGCAAGYTAVELMMSLAVLAIGVSGIMAMQRVTLAANRHAKAVATATRIAQAWIDQLQVDATTWNFPTDQNPGLNDLATETTWLRNVNTGWFRPTWDVPRLFGPAFDALGNPVPVTSTQEHVFCTDVRLTRLFPAGSSSGVIRTEVRVFWFRENGTGGVSPQSNLCTIANTPASVSVASLGAYHFIYLTSAVRQQPAE